MKKIVIIVGSAVSFLLILAIGLFLFNYIRLQSVLNDVIKHDPLNHGIEASVNYENYIDTSTIVFKLKPLPNDKNIGDAYRVILQFIDRINPNNFEQMDFIFNNQKTENILLTQYELQNLMEKVLEGDQRNKDIQVLVYYSGLTNSKELVYDLRDISGEKSQLDIFRVFLQYAQLAKDYNFETVNLYFQGSPKFKIHGDYFGKIGKELDFQNPVYTIRTFPENVMNPDGTNAFPQWTGGVLGVLKEQMEDFDDFNKKWYLESWATSQNNTTSNN